MILIFSSQADDCAAQVYARLRDLGQEVALIDDSLDSLSLGMNWFPEESAERSFLEIEGRRVPSGEIQGILLRYLNPLAPHPEQAPHDQQYVLYELSAALQGFLDAVECRVINRPNPGTSGKKLYLRPDGAGHVRSCGFKIPVTGAAASREAVLAFSDRLTHNAVVMGGITTPVLPRVVATEAISGQLDEIFSNERVVPLYLQELPTGNFYQLYVAGDRVCAVGGESWQLDMNSDESVLCEATLDESIAEACVELVKNLGLEFAQVNLLESSDDEWYCFDVNEFPVYGHCSKSVQDRINGALAELLMDRVEAPA